MKVLSYFIVHDKWTLLVSSGLTNIVIFAVSVITGAYTIEIFPREKLGQFCSAQMISYTFAGIVLNPFIGMLFDRLRNNRLSFMWTAFFFTLSALAYRKVYLNWKKRHGHPPVPHAG